VLNRRTKHPGSSPVHTASMEQTYRDHDAYREDPASAGPPPAQWHDDGYGCESWASQHHYDAAAASHGGDSCDSWASERHFDAGAADDGSASCDNSGSESQPGDGPVHGDNQSYSSSASERHRAVAELAGDSDRRSDLRPELHHDSTDADDDTSSGDRSQASERHCAPGCETHDEHCCNSEASDAAEASEAAHSDASTDTADAAGYASTEGGASSIATACTDHSPPAAVIRGGMGARMAAGGDSDSTCESFYATVAARGTMGARMAAGTDSDSGPELRFTAEIKRPESGIDSDATTEADEHDSSADARACQPDAAATLAASADAVPASPAPQRLHVEEDLAHALFRRNPGVRRRCEPSV